MNDDLVKRLREGDHFEKVMSAGQAADRVEALEAEMEARIAEAVKVEREACAEIADEQAAAWADSMTAFHGVPSATRIATAIRARGNQ